MAKRSPSGASFKLYAQTSKWSVIVEKNARARNPRFQLGENQLEDKFRAVEPYRQKCKPAAAKHHRRIDSPAVADVPHGDYCEQNPRNNGEYRFMDEVLRK